MGGDKLIFGRNFGRKFHKKFRIWIFGFVAESSILYQYFRRKSRRYLLFVLGAASAHKY
jgi:hypothetical protein